MPIPFERYTASTVLLFAVSTAWLRQDSLKATSHTTRVSALRNQCRRTALCSMIRKECFFFRLCFEAAISQALIVPGTVSLMGQVIGASTPAAAKEHCVT